MEQYASERGRVQSLAPTTQWQLTGTSVARLWQVPLGASTQRQLTGTSLAPQWHLSGKSVALLLVFF